MRAQEEAYPSKVTVSFSQNGQAVTSVPYGSTVTVTATMEKAETAANVLSADAGKVDFYLGDANDFTGMKMGTGTVEFVDGAYTASVDVTIDQDKGFNNAGTFKFTADFGGYAPEGNENGDSLAPNTGSAELTVTKAEQTAPSAPTVSTTTPPTANSITLDAITTTGQGDVQYGYTTGGETSVPDDRWQAETTFNDLDPGTTYTFYARYAGNGCYEPSPASSPGLEVTTERADSTLKIEPDEDTLTYGETLTITVTPEQTAANGINTQTAQNAVELKKGDTVLASTTTANGDGSYTLTYDTQGKGLAIGSNTLTVSFGGSGSLNPSTGEVTVTLEKANVNATLGGMTSKTYDGTTAAPTGLTIALTGVQEGDDVTASSSSITYDSADAGENKTITANNITLTGSDAAYYSLISETASVETGSITPASLNGTLTITGTAQYDQTLTANYTSKDDETVSYQWNRGNQSITGATGNTYTLTAEDVGQSITVTATATDKNHTGSVTSEPVTVGKASMDEDAIEIATSESTIELDSEGTILTATITDIAEEDKAKYWTWTSSDESIAKVTKLTPTDGDPTPRATGDLTSTARVTPVEVGQATITVTYTGTKYTATKTYDITVKAKEDEPTSKPDPTPIYYNIQFENICEGVDASLYIEVEEGYDAENLKVLCKRSLYGYWEEVEEGVQPGEYIIYNVYNDIYVKVEGVEKIEEDPTGMSDIEGTKVYAQNGSLYVYTSQLKEVAIITMGGTVLRRERQEGLRSYSLPKGVYIICIGEETFKVRN